MSVLKAEIVRLARKEAKSAAAPIRKPSVAARKALAGIKRRVAALEKEIRRIDVALAKVPAPQPEAGTEEAKVRITAKGIRSLRRKLSLTRKDFGRLLGITQNAVYVLERREGPLRVRSATKAAYLAARGLGARGARAKVAELAAGQQKAKPAKRGRKAKR
jgi:DNA-binding XRE family transcriptional regulator